MCRNLHQLHNLEPAATRHEVYGAALQYVRKVSGSTRPIRKNADAFDRAVDAVTEATQRLLEELVATTPPRDREALAAAARKRGQARARRAG